MLKLREENTFKKDLKRIKKRGKDIEKLKSIVKTLALKNPLPRKNKNHQLTGNYKGFHECHIEPDWLLIYHQTKTTLTLTRTGSHADLFK